MCKKRTVGSVDTRSPPASVTRVGFPYFVISRGLCSVCGLFSPCSEGFSPVCLVFHTKKKHTSKFQFDLDHLVDVLSLNYDYYFCCCCCCYYHYHYYYYTFL